MMLARIGKTAVFLGMLGAGLQSSPARADGEVQLSVFVSPNPVPERESLQLQIVVSAPLSASVEQPQFDAADFTVMGSPGLNFIPDGSDGNPNSRKKLTYTFVLMPRRPGNFWVRNIRLKAAGKPWASPDVMIKVTPAATPAPGPAPEPEESTNPAAPGYGAGNASRQQDGPPAPAGRGSGLSIPDRFNADFTLWASPSKVKAYVGEPIIVEYHIYDYGGLRQSEIRKWPTFDGFWKEDLELTTHVTFDEVYLQRQEMRRAFIARYALYGIKPGKVRVDKLGIRGKSVATDQIRPGVVFGFDTRTTERYSQDLLVDILPLPEHGKPATFNGAVGRFTLQLETDKTTVAENTPVTFTVTLSGVGNFQAIDSFRLRLPPEFEVYESTANGRAQAPLGVRQDLEQSKTFQVTAIPRRSGKFEIPSTSWSYFDTESESYTALNTPQMLIEVTPNQSAAGSQNSYLGQSPAAAPGPERKELPALRPWNENSPVPKRNRWMDGLLLLLGLANFSAAALLLRGRLQPFLSRFRKDKQFSEARMMLLQAKGMRDSGWQAGLEEVVFHLMQVLLGTNPRGMARAELEDAWRNRNLPAQLFQRMEALLSEIDRQRFSSQKLEGHDSRQVRSRLTKETEAVLLESVAKARKK